MKRDKYRNYRDSFWLDVSLEIILPKIDYWLFQIVILVSQIRFAQSPSPL